MQYTIRRKKKKRKSIRTSALSLSSKYNDCFLATWQIWKNRSVKSWERLKTIHFHEMPCSKSLLLQYVYMAKLPSLYTTSMFPCRTSAAFCFLVVCFLKWNRAYLSKTLYRVWVQLSHLELWHVWCVTVCSFNGWGVNNESCVCWSNADVGRAVVPNHAWFLTPFWHHKFFFLGWKLMD